MALHINIWIRGRLLNQSEQIYFNLLNIGGFSNSFYNLCKDFKYTALKTINY